MSLRVEKKKNEKYYYALDHDDAVKVRWLGVIGIFTTLNLIGGFYFFVTHSIFALLVFGPLAVIVILYLLINAVIMSQYPGFSIEWHKRRVNQFKKYEATVPKVAVMIPAAGESLSVVKETVLAATKIEYPNFEVFLLDDSKNAMYETFVQSSDATYFRRDNVGVHKKAGNLNALLGQLEGFDHILVLDADFVPDSEILNELVPYTAPEIGIVQSPQHFKLTREIYKKSKFEYGAALIQRDFYRITQVARNKLGGAICVGTNALYNIKALRAVGGYEGVGPKEWGHSEDVFTGLKMLNLRNERAKPFKIMYVPVMLAQGTCPDDHLSFYKQQNRWATGSMQLIFSKKTMFSRELTLAQKLCYFSNSTYYFYTMAILFSPIQILFIVLTNVTVSWEILFFFIPSLLVNLIAIPFILRQTFNPIAGSLVVISNAYTFIQALFLILIRRPLGWEATGAKSPKKRNYHFLMFKVLCSICFVAIYLVTLVAILINERFEFSPIMVIIGTFIVGMVIHLVYIHHMFVALIDVRRIHRNSHAYAYLSLIFVTVFMLSAGIVVSAEYDLKIDARAIQLVREDPSE